MKAAIVILVIICLVFGGLYLYKEGVNSVLKKELLDAIDKKELEIAVLKASITALEDAGEAQAIRTTEIHAELVSTQRDRNRILIERDDALARMNAASNDEVVEETKRILNDKTIFLRNEYIEFSFRAAKTNVQRLIAWESYRDKEVPNLQTSLKLAKEETGSVISQLTLMTQQRNFWMNIASMREAQIVDWRDLYKLKNKNKFWVDMAWRAGSFLAGMIFEKVF